MLAKAGESRPPVFGHLADTGIPWSVFSTLFRHPWPGNTSSLEFQQATLQHQQPFCVVMTPLELKLLAESWIACSRAELGTPESEAHFWAMRRESELLYREPLLAWALVLEVLRLDSSSTTLEQLSAGPLEVLLVYHGSLVIELVEAEAKQNPKFAHLLGGIWKSSTPDEIWARVEAVRDRRGWDGIPSA